MVSLNADILKAFVVQVVILDLELFTRVFCVPQLTSWSMCLTVESVEDKLQRIISGYLGCIEYQEFITYARVTIEIC